MRIFWHNPKNGRMYSVHIYQDEPDKWILVKEWWGSKKPGNQKISFGKNQLDLIDELEKIKKRREKRGYHQIY